ncbi:unnamed protein product, partial [Dovyalis caffra]
DLVWARILLNNYREDRTFNKAQSRANLYFTTLKRGLFFLTLFFASVGIGARLLMYFNGKCPITVDGGPRGEDRRA